MAKKEKVALDGLEKFNPNPATPTKEKDFDNQ